MYIRKVHCLFEQSGTFKNEFKRLGYDAEDYDIQNDFNETDNIVDLFAEIDKAYDGKPSIFDGFEKDDLIIAFFPCVRFEARIPLMFRGEAAQQRNWTAEEKLNKAIQLHTELHDLYKLICKLFLIAFRRGWKMIVENPYTQPHYLTTYFPIKPAIIDKNRRQNGDYYKKPTQYWFVNCKPEQNMFFETLEECQWVTSDKAWKMEGDKSQKVKRSLMHPQYAKRFIRTFIMEKEDVERI